LPLIFLCLFLIISFLFFLKKNRIDIPSYIQLSGKSNICVFFTIDPGTGDYLTIYSINCEKVEQFLESISIKEISSRLNHNQVDYIDRYDGLNCAEVKAIDYEKKEIVIEQNQFCTHFVNFSNWKQNKIILRLDESGSFIY
jgi:hypothetical protein